MSAPVLSREDLNSQAWRKLKAHLEDTLRSLRQKNDSDQTPEATARIRGEIRCIKNLLALDEIPAPAQEAEQE